MIFPDQRPADPQWRPLSLRLGLREIGAVEGFPEPLNDAVKNWATTAARAVGRAKMVKILLAAGISFPDEYPDASPGLRAVWSGYRNGSAIRHHTTTDDQKLDIVDALLYFDEDTTRAGDLAETLAFGNSVWRVRRDGLGLERRVSESLTDLAELTIDSIDDTTSSAAEHLHNAWQACWGRHADPSKSLSEAIKAVESAAAPVVSPHNRKATLGTILGELRANRETYELPTYTTSTNPVDHLIGMMELLWHGQSDRHGGVDQTTPVQQDQAEAALPVAIAVVQLFNSGAVRKL